MSARRPGAEGKGSPRLRERTSCPAVISQALLGALFDPLPLASRLLLIAQCGALAVAPCVDLKRGRLDQSFPGLPATLVRWVAAGIVVLLAGAVLAIVVGHLGAARIMRNFVSGALGLLLLLPVAAGLIYGLALALMRTRVGSSLRIVGLHCRSRCPP